MAYDEVLAGRIRHLLGGEVGVREQKMFGGLGFMIDDNMAVAASGEGGITVRVDPGRADRLVTSSHAYPVEMRGRELRGWLRVDAEHVRTTRQLARWVTIGADRARALAAT